MARIKNKIKIDKNKCQKAEECKLCLASCPPGVFIMYFTDKDFHDPKNWIIDPAFPQLCTECNICIDKCPNDAIQIKYKDKNKQPKLKVTMNEPEDIFGMAVVNLFTPFLEKEAFQKKIKNWKKTVVIDMIDLYPFSIVFDNGKISAKYGQAEKYQLKIIVGFDTFMGLAEGSVGMIRAVLKRKIRVKKIYNVFTILKFVSLLMPALKKATNNELMEGQYKL